jgi:hypothetical protein
MRPTEILVFNDIIYNGVTAYTSAAFNAALAQHDRLAVMAVIDNVSASSTFDLFIEQSCDGRNWLQRNDVSQASPAPGALGGGDITVPSMVLNGAYARLYADSAWGITKIGVSSGNSGGPLLGHVRFAMKLSAGFAHVKLHAVLRDTTAPAAARRAPGIRL